MQVVKRRRGRPKAFNAPESPNIIQSLDRALDVLEALASPEGLTLSELAAHLGQSAATMHRVLSTLERREFVEISPDRQVWHIGPEAYRLGSAFLRRTNVVERSRPIMRELMLETGETSNLGVEKDGNVLFISQVETHESIRAFFPPGTLSPLHASGIGKALLSTYDDSRLASLFKKTTLERFTANTVRSVAQLEEELRVTRDRGYALDDEERTKGMRCVAAPILNVHGEAVAGISVSGPTHRMPDRQVQQIGERVRNAAKMVSRRLGAP
ncbi:HTH-type transcriptional regulator BhcR [Sinorhizobium americanum]|uniref:Acetate operon repressor n=1 Tax=Sinorhizobium americanum TaxID=194963 RepID=A0A1L3LYU2_9HYPH|nr:HTH-type transcriptional regulator BhcR [Sinorhizobium americanum]APG95275.1 acetate operon repressor [Sinorhizobium americanum]OAP35706.1 IclR family transcriptional regulator [Sinorhizobium americanum]